MRDVFELGVVHLHKPVHKFLTHLLLPVHKFLTHLLLSVHGVADSMK